MGECHEPLGWLSLPDGVVDDIRKFNVVKAQDSHLQVGRAFAERQVLPGHFPPAFDAGV